MLTGRLTTVPSREAPAHIVQALREIDHRAELVELRPGVWILGVVVDNEERIRRGTALLEQELRKDIAYQDPGRIRFARLCMQGFGQVAMYKMSVPDGRIVEDFGERDFNYRHHLSDMLKRNEEEMDDTAGTRRATDLLLEAARSQARSIVRIIFRRKRSFSGSGWDFGRKSTIAREE